MEDKKYVCVRDFENTHFLLGKALTLEEWKAYILKDRVDRFYEDCGLFNDMINADFTRMINLRENEVKSYIEDFYEIKLIPLENGDYKYIDVDEHKLLTDADLRNIVFGLEVGDVQDNMKEYACGELSIDIWCNGIKKCFSGDIEWLLNELDLFGYYIVKIQ